MKTALALACVLALAACGTETVAVERPSVESGTTIEVANFAFEPQELTVNEGTTIRWTNRDDIAHTVTSGVPKKQGVPGVTKDRAASPDGVFDSGTLELDDTFEFTAAEVGSYTYFCAIHAGMRARLIVR